MDLGVWAVLILGRILGLGLGFMRAKKGVRVFSLGVCS